MSISLENSTEPSCPQPSENQLTAALVVFLAAERPGVGTLYYKPTLLGILGVAIAPLIISG